MKKSLLAMLLAVALVAPVFAAKDMWIGGSLGYENVSMTNGPKDSSVSWSISPEFGYSINETWDIGIDLSYSSDENSGEFRKINIGDSKVTAVEIAPFARYKLFSIGSFDVLAKGKLFFVSAKADDADATIDGYGIAIAPVITYSINETWSIGCTLNFAELGYTHVKGDKNLNDQEANIFGFNANDGSIISVGFSYHF
ncbi:outer membrane beta-barrel protein [Candidatus Ruminimicrobium bovinum]|uniref:outer membrane beta-barrel protein n=1 Tax=Candidatus Ruminimicrobium bovinum TaxID=3242779 RepID=UPI0039B95C38